MQRNTPELWDAVWKDSTSAEEDRFALAQEEHGARWRRIERIVLDRFGSFEGLRVVEIGAGMGTNAALMAARGAKVTLLDYSPLAIEGSRKFFERNGLTAEFVQADALALSPELLGAFDVSMSFGLAEHFLEPKRSAIVRAHLEVLRPGGISLVSVPNRHNPPYRIFKFAAELARVWKVGEEYPFSRKELARMCDSFGVDEYWFFGDSIAYSLHFINPVRAVRRLSGRKDPTDITKLRTQKGTALDEYVAYALVLAAVRPENLAPASG
jgi:SAM-dependent methyltransferase